MASLVGALASSSSASSSSSSSSSSISSSNLSSPPRFYRLEEDGDYLDFKSVNPRDIKGYSALETLRVVERNVDSLKIHATTLECVESILGAYRNHVNATLRGDDKSWSHTWNKVVIIAKGSTLEETLTKEAAEVEAVYLRIIAKWNNPEVRPKDEIRALEAIGKTPENAAFISNLFTGLDRDGRRALSFEIQKNGVLIKTDLLEPLKRFVALTTEALAKSPSNARIKYLAVYCLINPQDHFNRESFIRYTWDLLCLNELALFGASRSYLGQLLRGSQDAEPSQVAKDALKWVGRLCNITNRQTKIKIFYSLLEKIAEIDRVLICFPEEKREKLFLLVAHTLAMANVTEERLIHLFSLFDEEGKELLLRKIAAGEYPPISYLVDVEPSNMITTFLFRTDARLIDSFYRHQIDLLQRYHRDHDKNGQKITLDRIFKQAQADQTIRFALINGLKLVPEDQRAVAVEGISPYFWQESATIPWRSAVVRCIAHESGYLLEGSCRKECVELLDNHHLLETLRNRADELVMRLRALPKDQRAVLIKWTFVGLKNFLDPAHLLMFPKAERMAHVHDHVIDLFGDFKIRRILENDIRDFCCLFPDGEQMEKAECVRVELNRSR